jgi:hypothetical protein
MIDYHIFQLISEFLPKNAHSKIVKKLSNKRVHQLFKILLMDTRKKTYEKKAEPKVEIKTDEIIAEDEEFIKIDDVKNNESYLDSLVYNLCMKFES